MSNYKSLSILRILKSTISLFVNSFFVMYFLSLSNNNVAKLGVYYMIIYCLVFITYYLFRNICKTNKRIHLFRLGILLDFIYFLLIFILREKIVDYVYLIAVIYGIEEGMYYGVYNNLESTGIDNKQRAKFTGIYTFISSIISILVPILFGAFINEKGFSNCVIIVLALSICQILVSIVYKDVELKDTSGVNLTKYHDIIMSNKVIKDMYTVCILNGLVFSGAFSKIVTLYIIKVLSSSLSLGIFTSVFAIISSIIGLLIAKVIPSKSYSSILKMATVLMVSGIFMLMFKVNFITVVIFNLFQQIAGTFCNLIIGNAQLNVSNYSVIKKKYKVEYFLEMERSLFFGRVIGYILFIIFGLATSSIISNGILLVFAIFIVVLCYYCIKLRNDFNNCKGLE